MPRKKSKVPGYCGLCQQEGKLQGVAIFKKGKKHKVIICPKHGVIYTNPIPLMALAGAADWLSSAVTGKSLTEHAGSAMGQLARGNWKFWEPQEEEYIPEEEEEYYEEEEE